MKNIANLRGAKMNYRKIGKDLTVSSISFGCMGMTHTFGVAADKAEMTRVLHGAVERGHTMFDTAEVYISDDGSDEHNEDLVGEALKPYRNKIKIATKFGIAFGKNGFIYDVRPEKIRSSLETSLKRLQTDYIDVYYLHRYNPEDSIEDVAGVMAELIKEGKILNWGLSVVGEEVIRRAHKVCPLTAIQNHYSMLNRDSEQLFPVLEELGIGLVSYSPLDKGFLSAAYDKNTVFPKDDWRSRMPYFETGMDANKALIDALRSKAAEKNATSAQISLAWIIGKKPFIVPIPGTRNFDRMNENAGAADVVLTPEEIEEFDVLLDSANFLGLKNARF